MIEDSKYNVAQWLTFTLANQLFGVSVLKVNDVLGPPKITRTPLAPPAVAGVMNLRGRIVTAIDLRRCLKLPKRDEGQSHMSVVVDQNGELFSLMIDSIGDVLSLSQDTFDPPPATLAPEWRNVSEGIHKLEDQILMILNVEQLLIKAAERPTLEGKN